jgi:succinyl-CoA:(S)-malate CoA-transferase subunit A
MFERLAVAMEQPHLSSSNLYGDQRKRLADRDRVNTIVVDWVGSLTREQVLERCLAEEVPVGKVNSIADIFEDEQFLARGDLLHMSEDGIDDIVIPGVVPHLSKTPGRVTNLGPTLGNATDEVMRDLLGLAASEIARLRQQRII